MGNSSSPADDWHWSAGARWIPKEVDLLSSSKPVLRFCKLLHDSSPEFKRLYPLAFPTARAAIAVFLLRLSEHKAF